MSKSEKKPPFYKQRRIGTLRSLCIPLGLNLKELLSLSDKSDYLYRKVQSITKKDGNIRDVYDALPPLKSVHKRIKTHILDHVVYPVYLTGSLRGCDYKANAELHSKARIVINEDITSFFSSTVSGNVYNVWRNFFGFSKEVSTCLARLTTRKNQLPQGAITSSFLANLVFWKDECELYNLFLSQGLIYSRYVDDIAVSSSKFLTNDDKKNAVMTPISRTCVFR
ncbi:reverse transcriptase family protein [Sodalis endosymbiont of Spalangia cameroni]|uniref:reverse transcriptase family protein n=1 Tax=Sodalis praecaptivus TaxID=1239307 RepID=UPI0031F9DB6F